MGYRTVGYSCFRSGDWRVHTGLHRNAGTCYIGGITLSDAKQFEVHVNTTCQPVACLYL